MAISYGPNNDVRNYVPTQQRLGNKTLFTTSVKNGDSTVRYFSGTDAEIYFDEVYVDEVVQIQYQLQQNTLPLFGYNSYVYDQIARGSRLINGSFTINFTQANYLYDVLNVLSEKPLSTDTSVNKDNEGTVDDFDDANRYTLDNQSKIAMGNVKGSVWERSFEIIISYGDAKQSVPNSTMLALTGVVLTGCSQVLGINGEPVYETYNFVARDITSPAAINNTSSTATATPAATPTEKEDIITINSITYNESAGYIKLSYDSSYSIDEVSFQPLLGSKVAMMKLVDSNTSDKNTITYYVPQLWKDEIKKYYVDKKKKNQQIDSNKSNSYTLGVRMIFSYRVNGTATTKIMTGTMWLDSVYI